jgi:hypothetical protein
VVAGLIPATTQLIEGLRMTERQKTTYEIRVRGHLDEKRSEWFGGMSITHQPNGETILFGEIVDQSTLNAILNRIQAMNIKLISVERVDPEAADGDAAGKFVDLGLEYDFLKEVGDNLGPGSSAVVALVDFEQVDRAMEELEKFEGGTIQHHTLSPEVYQKLADSVED